MENRTLKNRLVLNWNVGMAAVVVLLVAAAAWFWLFFGARVPVPTYSETIKNFRTSDGILVDRRGDPLFGIRIDFKSRKLPWTGLGEISPALKSAVVAVEDRRFFNHPGVDFSAASVAFLRWLIPGMGGESLRGASTITMQTVSMLDMDTPVLVGGRHGRRSLLQKYQQIKSALALERSWTKVQILEAYLNLVPLRGELVGVTAASWILFGKAPSGLDEAESQLLAALIQAPNADVATLTRRVCRMKVGDEDCPWNPQKIESALGAIGNPNERANFSGRFYNNAPHVARLAAKSGVFTSHLDADIQRYAEASLSRTVQGLRGRNVNDGAVLVVENDTGKVLAYVGNVAGSTTQTYVDGVRSPRQAGSTLKPLLYAQAFDRRLLTPTSLLEDRPLAIAQSNGVYSPQNYSHTFSGDVEVRAALASSLNIPAVRTLLMVGVEVFRDKLHELGFRDLREGSFYGPALALGAVDVSLWDLVRAYHALSRGGVVGDLQLFRDSYPLRTVVADDNQVDKTRAFSDGASFLVANILSDRGARSSAFGLENNLAMPFWAAVKTGTSKDMRDNWCIGFTRKYTVGVWVGNFSGAPMWDVSGIDGAAPVWRDVMNYMHREAADLRDSTEILPPKSVIHLPYAGIDQGAQRPVMPQMAWYLRGTSPGKILKEADEVAPRISYPPDGVIMALDPDIPGHRQRVAFKRDRSGGDVKWVLNNSLLCSDTDAEVDHCHGDGPTWVLERGRHKLELRSKTGMVLDTVRFQVR